MGGAEQQAMHGRLGRLFGKYSEEMFFEGDQSPLNPMRYVPTPFHTKLAQQRSPLSQYIQQEAVGTRMRRWDRPLHDFLLPYLRGAIGRVTGTEVIPYEVEHRRDLDTLTDMTTTLGSSPLGAYKFPRARAGSPVPDLSGGPGLWVARPVGVCYRAPLHGLRLEVA